MWFIGVEVEQETSAPSPKKNPGSAPDLKLQILHAIRSHSILQSLYDFELYTPFFLT